MIFLYKVVKLLVASLSLTACSKHKRLDNVDQNSRQRSNASGKMVLSVSPSAEVFSRQQALYEVHMLAVLEIYIRGETPGLA